MWWSVWSLTHLEVDLQVLGLCVQQDVWLHVLQHGHTHVHLVVGAHEHTGGHVVADLRPVQVVPEALVQPLQANLESPQKHIHQLHTGR